MALVRGICAVRTAHGMGVMARVRQVSMADGAQRFCFSILHRMLAPRVVGVAADNN